MVTPATLERHRTDLYGLWNVVQNTQLSLPKELIISVLRDEFSKDSYYHFVKDEYGFPKTPDHTDLPMDAGFNNDVTTRLFIGEPYRFDVAYLPAILVRTAGNRYKPISINRNKETVKYDSVYVTDGYFYKPYSIPSRFVLAGAWEGTIQVDIMTKDIKSRDDLVAMCSLIFADIRFEELMKAGVVVKSISAGAPSETEDFKQYKLYKQSINLDIWTEWRREIPVESMVDSINFCIEFGNLQTEPPQLATGLSIRTRVDLLAQIDQLNMNE